MRILWVKVGGLWPLDAGGRIRSFHLVVELSRRHRLTLVTTHGRPEESKGLAAALTDCERVISLPHLAVKQGSRRFASAVVRSWASPLPVDLWRWRVPAVRNEVKRLLGSGSFDLCVADFLAAVPNIPAGGATPVVLFEHNVECMIWRRLRDVAPPGLRRALLELEWRKMRRYEASACRRARLTIAVSETDRTLLATNAQGAEVRSIPTGVDVSFFSRNGSPEVPASLVFTGSMDWYPNEDAVRHFVQTILPRIRREVAEVRLTIVGRNPSLSLKAAMAHAAVSVTGTVDDVRPYVAPASVCVVPQRVGGGTRLKIFEALAMGKAVVSTSVGAEGLPLIPGQHCLCADDPDDFARAVVSLLRDPGRRAALGAAGRRLVEERYSWAHVAREFEACCEGVVTNHAS